MSSDRALSPKALTSRALSLAAAAAVIGSLAYVMVTLLHPPGIADDHPATFRQYALSYAWIAIHLAQLVCLVVGLVGLAGVAMTMLRFQEQGHLLALLAVILAVIASLPQSYSRRSMASRSSERWMPGSPRVARLRRPASPGRGPSGGSRRG
jgi:DMSO reductase anchor subunit